MKICHQISHYWESYQVSYLKTHGITVNKGHDVFEIEEGSVYEAIRFNLYDWNVSDWVGTRFSQQDESKAPYNKIIPNWLNDYPQPENDYLEVCYDLTNYCSSCGVGKVQMAPLMLKRDPKWGRKSVFALNWIFDEIFVRKEYYEKVFKPLGVQAQEVLLARKRTVIESTVQLTFSVTTMSSSIKGHSKQVCNACGREKYELFIKGFFPKFSGVEELLIFKSQEYFGSGAQANKGIFITSELYQKLYSDKVNVSYYPTE